MFELLNNSGTGLQMHKRCYCMCLTKLQICVSVFFLCISWKGAQKIVRITVVILCHTKLSQIVTDVLCNKSYLCSNI